MESEKQLSPLCKPINFFPRHNNYISACCPIRLFNPNRSSCHSACRRLGRSSAGSPADLHAVPLPSSALPELPRLDSWAALTPGNAGAVSWSRSAAPDRFQHHPRQAFLSFHCPLVVLRFQPFCRLLLWLQPRRTACTLDCAGRTGLPNCCSASSDLKRGFPAEDTRVPLMQILPTPSLLFHSFQWEWAFWAQAAMSRLMWM